MTHVGTRAVDYARSQVGVSEWPPRSNCQGYSWWQYGVRCPGGGWCASFVSRCTVEGGFVFEGATHGARGFSYTESAEAWARARGIWRDKHWKAQPGDWVIFDWGTGGPTDHVGMVERHDGSKMITVEGNTSDAVKFRTRDLKYVVGYVAFSQSPQSGPPPPPPPPKPTWKVPVIFLTHPDRGTWIVMEGPGGQVNFLSPTGAIVPLGMDQDPQDKAAFGNRQIKKLHPRTRNDGKPGFMIEAGDNAKYVPKSQI